jgi:3-oxoacyl-[acyl-carrier-protein] synthase III
VDLSSAAAEACLENFDGDRTGIEVLIYAGVYRTEYLVEPATAALIAGELGMYDDSSPVPEKRTLCFDVVSGAAGFLKALHVAAQMMQSKRAKRVLMVTSEIDCNAGHPEKACAGLEPTASALLLEAASEGEGFQGFAFRDFPEYINAFRSHCDLFVPGGVLEVHRDAGWEELYLNCIEATVEGYLQETGLDRSAFRAVLAPQISPAFLDRLGQRLGFSDEVLVKVLRFKDDLFTSSLPYAFWELEQRGAVRPGELGLCLAVGAGIQVGCAVYRF